ncbi:MAG: ATP-dependent RNA helicase HrpA [Halieaceae bacterium]|nr:ATP-dependent RNA helicase HrpA [Halieaceae bacterium]
MSVPVPTIDYPAELPITERLEEISAALAAHQVVIVAGETGSGKTTQLPKLCLALGRGERRIGHTQPRRLAARTVAQRIAEELGESLGETVGYQVRFTDTMGEGTRVKLMTDGILLAEIQRDRMLRQYDTLIIDEAHERSLNIDFLLGYLKQLLPKRPDLKLIITSATIDVEGFSAHFDDAPVIEVSGRSYPIQTHYLDDEEGDVIVRAADAVESILNRDFGPAGDTLVFLSGEREIRELALALRRRQLPGLEVLPLYARLSQAEQSRVFDTRKRAGMRVVLATNVAETSLTVPGIRFVVDTGLARISRYSVRSKLQRLPVEPISQASANQRQGRCGRVAEGVCLRLYSEQDFLSRPEFTEPEIQRTNLAAVILRMIKLKLGAVEAFPFINPPDARLVRDGYRLLQELTAVDEGGRLTALGHRMAELPVDPRFARMLLAAAENGSLAEMLVIASALSVQDPRERPVDKQQAADEKHRRFWDERSDFMAWLRLWDYYEEQRQALSQNQLRKLCQREFLAFMRMREWRDVHFQLTVACRQAGLRFNRTAATYEPVHRALLTGLLGNIAQWQEGREYLGSRNRKLQIFPGSSQAKKRPPWLLAAEIVETSQVFARCVARIDPGWALEANPALLKHHDYEPHWHTRSGRVMALRRTSLYGLVLADRQKIHYGPINPAEARAILIRAALVEGRMKPRPGFLTHNLALVEELETLESKARRRDLVADEQGIVAFYDERLPDNITTANRLRGWLKKHPEAEASLRLSREQLLVRAVDDEIGNQFPDHLEWEDFSLALSYHFEPGHPQDGVSVTIPVGLLNRVPRYRFDWLVPGLLREKCIALVKALPKALRKQLVPVPDFVDRALVEMEPADRPLVDALGAGLRAAAGVRIELDDWDIAGLDDYYRMNFRIVDADGKLLRQGRELESLIDASREQTRESLEVAESAGPLASGLTRWEIDELPERWRSKQAGIDIESYPALEDRGDSVAVTLHDYPGQAEVGHRRGLTRLYQLQCSQQVRYLRKNLLRGNAANLLLVGAGLARDSLLDDLLAAVFARAFLTAEDLPRNEAAFKAQLQAGRGELVNIGNDYERVLLAAFEPLVEVRKRLAGLADQALDYAREDIERQLEGLLGGGFLYRTPWSRISHYPRYMKALLTRLERLTAQPGKDRGHTDTLAELETPLHEALDERADALALNPELAEYRWMLEELRVSFFAQSLGTSQPVSVKRLAEQWSRVEAWQRANPQ